MGLRSRNKDHARSATIVAQLGKELRRRRRQDGQRHGAQGGHTLHAARRRRVGRPEGRLRKRLSHLLREMLYDLPRPLLCVPPRGLDGAANGAVLIAGLQLRRVELLDDVLDEPLHVGHAVLDNLLRRKVLLIITKRTVDPQPDRRITLVARRQLRTHGHTLRPPRHGALPQYHGQHVRVAASAHHIGERLGHVTVEDGVVVRLLVPLRPLEHVQPRALQRLGLALCEVGALPLQNRHNDGVRPPPLARADGVGEGDVPLGGGPPRDLLLSVIRQQLQTCRHHSEGLGRHAAGARVHDGEHPILLELLYDALVRSERPLAPPVLAVLRSGAWPPAVRDNGGSDAIQHSKRSARALRTAKRPYNRFHSARRNVSHVLERVVDDAPSGRISVPIPVKSKEPIHARAVRLHLRRLIAPECAEEGGVAKHVAACELPERLPVGVFVARMAVADREPALAI
mmetsp:Transcript_29315/g.72395  ORF Transcript_29315/g.72395 Transcript_29315/m.72395 type:complete len:456 (-) Transcript_29315:201-1568(-)